MYKNCQVQDLNFRPLPTHKAIEMVCFLYKAVLIVHVKFVFCLFIRVHARQVASGPNLFALLRFSTGRTIHFLMPYDY